MRPTPTKVPGIPRPPADINPELARYLNNLSEAVEIRLGRKGDPVDRAITLRELISSGLAVELRSNPYNPNNTPNDFGPAPDETIPDLDVPPVPTGFVAEGAYSVIVLKWDMPFYTGHALTEVWSHTEDVLGDATLNSVVSGRIMSDPVGSGVSRYYWIRHVNANGVVGPYNSASGTLAETSPDVDLLLETLVGAITSSELATDLATPIGNLPLDTAQEILDEASARATAVAAEASARATAIAAEASARATAIAQESVDRANAIAASAASLQSQINSLLNIPAYNAATTYSAGDTVSYDSKLYVASTTTTGNLPTNTTYWSLLGDYTSLGDAVLDNSADIVAINTVSASSTSAAARAVAALDATVSNPTTGLTATRATLINDYYTEAQTDSAIATAVTGLASTADLTDYVQTTYLTTNYYTKTDADAAISSAVTGLVSTTDLSNDYTNTAALELNYYTKTATDSAIASATTGLVSSTDLADYTTTAALELNYYTKTATDSAIASATSSLVSVTTLADYTTTAQLQLNYYTKTEADSAITAATTDFVSQTDLADYTTTANLQLNYYTKTEADTAIAAATTDFISQTDLADYTTTANLQLNYYTKTEADTAIATATTDFVSETDLDDYTTLAYLQATYRTETDTDQAIATATQGLVSTVTLEDNYTSTAVLQQNYYTKSSTDGAIATATSGFVSETVLEDYSTLAYLGTNHYTKTEADTATSGALATFSSGFQDPDGGSSSVTLQQAMTTQATLNGELKSSYTVKIDANGAVAGFGLSSTTNDAGNIVSEFIVNADRFAIMRGGSDGTVASVPFIVQSTTQVVDGITVPAGVYMADAFIKNASIVSAKIKSVNADTITTGSLSADRISGGTIDATNINIDGVTSGINLRSASTGARMEIRADVIKVFDSSNGLRVKLGNLA